MRPVIPNTAIFGMSLTGPSARAGEELLHALEEGLLAGLVTSRLERRFELLQELLLLRAQFHGSLDHHAAEQVARRAAAHGLHALLAHAKRPPGLRLARNLEHHVARQCRYFDGAAELGGGEAPPHLAGKMA